MLGRARLSDVNMLDPLQGNERVLMASHRPEVPNLDHPNFASVSHHASAKCSQIKIVG